MQLNADSWFGVDAWQQYVFSVVGNSIKGQINNWQNLTTALVCDSVDVASTPINNGIPKGYTLQITLLYGGDYPGDSVTGALFQVFAPGQSQPVGSQTFLLSQAGCNCNIPPGFQCTGDNTALSPITTFQVNIVGPGNSAATTFNAGGAGSIVYAVSNGALAAISNNLPACVEAGAPTCTAETSNATYGQLTGCPAQSLTQTFTG